MSRDPANLAKSSNYLKDLWIRIGSKKESNSIRKEMSSKAKPVAPNLDPKILSKVFEIANRGPKGSEGSSTSNSSTNSSKPLTSTPVRPPPPAPTKVPTKVPIDEEVGEDETETTPGEDTEATETTGAEGMEGSQLEQEIQYLDSLIPFLETLAQELGAGTRPSYSPQGVATSLATSANKVIAYLAQYAPETMRAGPVGFPMTPSSNSQGSVKSPRKERPKLPDISETQQRSLFGSTFVATTEPKNYLRVVGFTQKQVIVEPIPSSANGEIDKNWVAANPLNEPVVKSLPGQRARVTTDNGILFRNQKYTKLVKPTIPPPASPASPRLTNKR